MSIQTQKRLQAVLIHAVLIAGLALMLYPLAWLLRSSLMPNNQVFETPMHWIPLKVMWSNYKTGWYAIRPFTFGGFFLNSLFVTTTVVLGTMVSAALVGFGFARIPFKGRNTLFLLVLSTLMIPAQVTLVPQYILFKNLGWIDTFLPLTVPAWLGGGAFHIFLMRQFISGIPKELDEAARIDGCGTFGIFMRIILPLTKPALAAVAVFSFIWTYNDFLNPLIFLSDVGHFTLPIALRLFLDNESPVIWGPMFAMVLAAVIPCVVLFIAAQRYFVEGIATTGLKG